MHICEHMSTSEDRHKKYVNAHRIDKKFVVGEKVFLRVYLWKSLIRYGKGLKLAPHCVGPFEILERIGLVAYHLAFLPNLACVHDFLHVSILRQHIPNMIHVLDWNVLQVHEMQLDLEPMHSL